MIYMIVEHFRHGDAPVYERFHAHGRMAPDGLSYIASWATESKSQCFQLMETADRALLDEWMEHWADLIEFDVHPLAAPSAG